MTLPVSPNSISMSQVNVEIGKPSNATISLNDTAVRGLAKISSGTISMDSLRGTSSYTPMTVAGHNSISNSYPSTSPGTASAQPWVTVSGGSGGYTYKWTYMSGYGVAINLTNDTLSTCTVSKTYVRSSNDSFDAFLQCVVTDNTGHSVTVTNIEAYAQWGTAS